MEFHPVFFSSDADEALIGNHVRPDLIGNKEITHDPTKGLILKIDKPNSDINEFVPYDEIKQQTVEDSNSEEALPERKQSASNPDYNKGETKKSGEVEGFGSTYKVLAEIIIILFLFFILLSE